jgi:hypothetical protein
VACGGCGEGGEGVVYVDVIVFLFFYHDVSCVFGCLFVWCCGVLHACMSGCILGYL